MLGEERTRIAHIFRAKGAAHHQPGATPQGIHAIETPGAESAIHSETLAVSDALNRAFSACSSSDAGSWGDAPGLSDSAPLALNAGKGARTPTARKQSATATTSRTGRFEMAANSIAPKVGFARSERGRSGRGRSVPLIEPIARD